MTPTRVFLVVIGVALLLFTGSALFSYLGKVASQRSDIGVAAGGLAVALVLAGAAALVVYVIRRMLRQGADKEGR